MQRSLFLIVAGLLTASVPAVAMGTSPKTPKFKATAPVINEVTTAYQFRTRIKTDPACTRYATEADNVFLSASLDEAPGCRVKYCAKACETYALEIEVPAYDPAGPR